MRRRLKLRRSISIRDGSKKKEKQRSWTDYINRTKWGGGGGGEGAGGGWGGGRGGGGGGWGGGGGVPFLPLTDIMILKSCAEVRCRLGHGAKLIAVYGEPDRGNGQREEGKRTSISDKFSKHQQGVEESDLV